MLSYIYICLCGVCCVETICVAIDQICVIHLLFYEVDINNTSNICLSKENNQKYCAFLILPFW